MRFSRIITGVVTAGLVGLVPVAIGSPASATVNLTTTTTATPSDPVVTYGDQIAITLEVVASDGTSVIDGTSTLYAMAAGTTTWVPIATPTYPGSDIYPVVPQTNTTYKVVYSGYAATSVYEDNYAGSESAPFTVGVAREVTIDKAKAKLTIKGKVKPDYKRKKVKIQIKKGKKYVKFKTVKTTNKSTFQVRLPAPRRSGKLFFKIIVPGNTDFLGYSEVWYTYSYRSAITPRAVAKG